MTVGDIIAEIQGLVGDSFGDWAVPDFLVPLVKTAQGMLLDKLMVLPQVGRVTSTVVVPSIGAGSTNLSALFLSGGALETLMEPITIHERAAGSTSEADWREMHPAFEHRPSILNSFNQEYYWNGSTLLVPGADQDLSLRVFGSFRPAAITDEASPLVPGTEGIIKFRTAQLALEGRENWRLAAKREAQANEQQEDFMNKTVHRMQEAPIRQRSFSGRGRILRTI